MTPEIFTSLIAVSGAIILATVSYWLTKKREREAELRKEKLTHYKEFTISLGGVIAGVDTPEAHRAFSRATNNLNLVASQAVLEKLHTFQQVCRVKTVWKEEQNKVLSELFYAMRYDLGVTPTDNKETFFVKLYNWR